MGAVLNKRAFLSDLKAADTKARNRFRNMVENACELLHHEILSLTPVWSGSAVINYQWSVGSPGFAFMEPIDNGPPGHTNSMPLGAEPRRPPNEAESLTSLYGLSMANPFQVFYLNNNDPDIEGLEYGQLPSPPTSRSRQGMVGLSMAYVIARLGAGDL